MNEIVVKEESTPMRECDILSVDYGFDEKIDVATKVATSLGNVIESQGLAIDIQGNKYVTAEGWETLGTMLGCTPYVEEVVEMPCDQKGKFMYKATVSIMQGETVLSRASAMAERNNMQRDRPSVYSMAQTRALGKAYRMAFSWIVKMSGYAPTPAEEMQGIKRAEAVNNAKAKLKRTDKRSKAAEEAIDVEVVK